MQFIFLERFNPVSNFCQDRAMMVYLIFYYPQMLSYFSNEYGKYALKIEFNFINPWAPVVSLPRFSIHLPHGVAETI